MHRKVKELQKSLIYPNTIIEVPYEDIIHKALIKDLKVIINKRLETEYRAFILDHIMILKNTSCREIFIKRLANIIISDNDIYINSIVNKVTMQILCKFLENPSRYGFLLNYIHMFETFHNLPHTQLYISPSEKTHSHPYIIMQLNSDFWYMNPDILSIPLALFRLHDSNIYNIFKSIQNQNYSHLNLSTGKIFEFNPKMIKLLGIYNEYNNMTRQDKIKYINTHCARISNTSLSNVGIFNKPICLIK